MRGNAHRTGRAFQGIELCESRLLLADTFSSAATLTATDPIANQAATFSMVGPGTGSVTVGADGIWRIALTGTTRKSMVSVKGAIDIQQITAGSMVGKFSAPEADWVAASGTDPNATMSFGGGLLSLTLRDARTLSGAGIHTLTIEKGDLSADATALVFRDIKDLTLTSQMPIASLNARSIGLEGSASQAITTAGWIGALKVSGDIATTQPSKQIRITARMPNPKTGLSIGSTLIGGSMGQAVVGSHSGNLGRITVTGSMTSSNVYTDYGGIGTISVGKNANTGKSMTSSDIRCDYGNIAGATIAGTIDVSQIHASDCGSLGPVSIGGSMINFSYIYATDTGSLSTVAIKGAMDHSRIYADFGDIKGVTIGGNVDNSSTIYTDEGNINRVQIGGNLDHNSEVYTNDGTTGLRSVTIGGNVANGANIGAFENAIGTITIRGDILGTSGSPVLVDAALGIKSLSVGGKAVYLNLQSDYGSIGSITIGGVLQNSSVTSSSAITINSISCARLDASNIAIAVSNINSLTDQRTDFTGAGVLKSLQVRDKSAGNVTNNSKVAVWELGTISFSGSSAGNGLFEYHTGSIKALPTGITSNVLA